MDGRILPHVKLLETRVYRGPNPYGYRPVIRLTVDLETLEDYPSHKIPGFVDSMLTDIPTLEEHVRRHVKDAMALTGGNQIRAAELLGIHRNTLATRLRDARPDE